MTAPFVIAIDDACDRAVLERLLECARRCVPTMSRSTSGDFRHSLDLSWPFADSPKQAAFLSLTAIDQVPAPKATREDARAMSEAIATAALACDLTEEQMHGWHADLEAAANHWSSCHEESGGIPASMVDICFARAPTPWCTGGVWRGPIDHKSAYVPVLGQDALEAALPDLPTIGLVRMTEFSKRNSAKIRIEGLYGTGHHRSVPIAERMRLSLRFGEPAF
jgi:hypothetical protein